MESRLASRFKALVIGLGELINKKAQADLIRFWAQSGLGTCKSLKFLIKRQTVRFLELFFSRCTSTTGCFHGLLSEVVGFSHLHHGW
jgi:hypothetical protein